MVAILLMTKAPQVGRVKTRLSPPLTMEQACLFHEALLKDTLTLMRSVSSARYLAYHGPRDWFDRHSPDFYLFAQQGEDLAVRLHHAFQFMTNWHSPVLCIGSDSPHIPTSYLQQTVALLANHDVVLGPATDGGYYLIAMSRFQPLFLGMPMSTPELCLSTQARCQELGLKVGLLPMMQDFDTWADIEHNRSQLDHGHTQRLLAHWDRAQEGHR